jgi:hypothetical protein
MRIARGNDKPHGMQASKHQANNTTVLDVIAMHNQSQYNKGENGENKQFPFPSAQSDDA